MTLERELPGTEYADDEPQIPGEPEERDERAPRRSWRRRLFWPTAILAGLLAIVIGTPLTVGLRVWHQARQDETPRSDAILVLGAAQYNGVPSATLRWRLEHAVKLYRRGVAPAIVTVGGKMPGDNYTEAEAGRRWLVQQRGVPANRVVAVPTGSDTLQSMQAVGRRLKQLRWDSVVIVTDPWHSLRSKKMASDQGLEAAASPTRSGPSVQTRDTQINYIVRETGGYLSYVLFGRSVRSPAELRPSNTPR